MNSSKLLAVASRLYVDVEIGLWAALLAFVFFFAVVIAPAMPEARTHAELLRAQEIAAEHDYYCEKLGMPDGNPGHAQCVLDLGAFRAKIEKRFADEINSF